ncbi:hypothetical protein GALMADRAFT_912658 [Galerina marginata CBS 339.88]|uniref:Uncharacterized protein n=1 Tax=Galerina marginata (strain CBS 339.88) TaxID=685588 RepID=A0A067SQ90_GALM3|nr:hypothetical protein GALMADRAFT_912658 [Galerina marginata CBS 339.88]
MLFLVDSFAINNVLWRQLSKQLEVIMEQCRLTAARMHRPGWFLRNIVIRLRICDADWAEVHVSCQPLSTPEHINPPSQGLLPHQLVHAFASQIVPHPLNSEITLLLLATQPTMTSPTFAIRFFTFALVALLLRGHLARADDDSMGDDGAMGQDGGSPNHPSRPG